jgi:hypothetical protein
MLFESHDLIGVFLTHAISTNFFLLTDFCEVVLHDKLCFLPFIFEQQKFLISCFIRFNLHWNCLFPCDTHEALLALS